MSAVPRLHGAQHLDLGGFGPPSLSHRACRAMMRVCRANAPTTPACMHEAVMSSSTSSRVVVSASYSCPRPTTSMCVGVC